MFLSLAPVDYFACSNKVLSFLLLTLCLFVDQRVKSFGSEDFVGSFKDLRGRHSLDAADDFRQRVIPIEMKKRFPESEEEAFPIIAGHGELSYSLFLGGGKLRGRKLRMA